MAQARYEYGTSPRKIEPDYSKKNKKIAQRKHLKIIEKLPKQEARVTKEQHKKQIKTTFTVIGLFLLLLTISCRNSQIDKQFNQIQEQKKQLAALQKENEQLKVSIENSQNLGNVEKVAKEELGMQKLSSKQTIYVTLPKKDYVESASEKVVMEEETSWLESVLNKIMNKTLHF